jgi:cytochrome-b5 reductase
VFELKDKNASLNLPVASYLVTKFKGADGKDVIRPYTPINQHEPGQLTLLIKDYPQGVMSRHIHSMKVGDSLEIKGPLPKVRLPT